MDLMGIAGLVIAFGWIVGIIGGQLVPLPLAIVVLGLLATACSAALAPAGRLRLVAVGSLVVLAGYGRIGLAPMHDRAEILSTVEGDVRLVGRVLDAPVPRGTRTETDIEVESIVATDGKSVAIDRAARPRVLARASIADVRYGDRVEARGRLSKPRSRPGWPLAEILARRQIYWVFDTGTLRVRDPADADPRVWLATVRDWLDGNLRLWLPEPTGSLVSGVVLGSRVGLAPELRAALATTGTTHLTAVSGFNVAIVAGGLLALCRWAGGGRWAVIPTVGGIWVYVLLVGAPPSALRAAAMLTVALVAQASGRLADSFGCLALAVAALLGWDPGLAFDLGFQLSVAATAGLILLAPPLGGYLAWAPKAFREPVAVALAAQLSTLPILLATFQTVSLVALPANLLVSPLVLPLTWLGVVLAVAAPLPGIGIVFGWAAWLVSTAMLSIIGALAQLPGAAIATGRPSPAFAIGWYVVLACWIAARSADAERFGLRPRLLRWSVLAALALTSLFAVVPAWNGPALQISLLDVDAGAAFVRTPSGRTAVVVTSDDVAGLTASVAQRLHGLGEVPDVVVSPAGAARVAELLQRYPAARPLEGVLVPPEPMPGDGTHPDDRVPVAAGPGSVVAGTRVGLGDGVSVDLVDVRTVDDRVVLDLRIQADGLAVWLPGPGQPSRGWIALVDDDPTILRLPSTAAAWLRPPMLGRWSVLVGQGVRAPEPASRRLLSLDQRAVGAVELTVNDGALEMRTERCDDAVDCRFTWPDLSADDPDSTRFPQTD